MKNRLLFILSLSLLGATAHAQTVASGAETPAATGPATTLETIVVTGSNLRAGAGAGTDSNLRMVTSAEIDHSGVTNVRDLFRTIPELGAGGTSENRVNTSSPATAGVSLRGLGVNSTLVLLNGRRVTVAPFGQGGSAAGMGTEAFVDLNQIPIGAISRVEVLKDGASAIYGADAVAGVINLILKDRVDDVTVTAGFSNYLGEVNSPTYRASIVGGAVSDHTSITVTADFFRREDIRFHELGTAVLSLTGTNPGTFVVPVGGINPITKAVIPVGTAAVDRTFTVERSTSAVPTFNTTTSATNRWDANDAIRPQTDAERMGGIVNFKHAFTSRLNLFVEAGLSKTTSIEGLGAAAIGTLNPVTLPANNPFNPFGVALQTGGTSSQSIFYRFTELGDSLAKTTNRMERLVAGVDGSVFQFWKWDASATYNRARSHNFRFQGNLSLPAVQAALNDTNPATALNIFTNGTIKNNPATLAGLESKATRDGQTELKSLDFKTSGPVFELPAGSVSIAVGAQFRQEEFSDQSSQVQILGRSLPNPRVSGDQDVTALFVESELPLFSPAQSIAALHSLSLNVAARYEKFSTSAGDTVVPKVGLRWQPFDEQITFRASWGKGFRAPSLFELYLPQTLASGFNITDPLRFGKPGSNINDGNQGPRLTLSGGNPNLTPEKSESLNFGVRFEPKFLPRFTFSVDYYRVEVTDRIGQPATTQIILSNPDAFPGAVVRAERTASDIANNLPGELIQIRTTLGNYGNATADGFDFAVDYRLPTNRFGTFSTRAVASYSGTRKITGIETVGTYEVPHWLGDVSGTWSYEKFNGTLGFNYIGDYLDVAPATTKVDDQITARLELTYKFSRSLSVSLGSYNLFNQEPPKTLFSTGYSERMSYYLPRSVYLNVSKTF